MKLVLASASPRRLQLLRSLGYDVHAVPSNYDEPQRSDLTPRDLAIAHAREKARVVSERMPNELVVGADTVVDVDGAALGKPRDDADAFAMLRLLAGRTHDVHTAFTLVDPVSKTAHHGVESTRVWFYDLADDEIKAYVSTGDSLDKAGAYGIQGVGATLVRRVEGDFYSVMGFPIGRFARLLIKLGLSANGAKQSSP